VGKIKHKRGRLIVKLRMWGFSSLYEGLGEIIFSILGGNGVTLKGCEIVISSR